MSVQIICNNKKCNKVIKDWDDSYDVLELTRWEGEGGMSFAPEELHEHFCDMKCAAQFTHDKLLEKINRKED